MSSEHDTPDIVVPFPLPPGMMLMRGVGGPRILKTIAGDEIIGWLLYTPEDGLGFIGRPLQILTYMQGDGSAQVFYKKWCGMSPDEIVPLQRFDFVAAVFSAVPSVVEMYMKRSHQFYEEIPAAIARAQEDAKNQPVQEAQSPAPSEPTPPTPATEPQPEDPHADEIARMEAKTNEREHVPVFLSDNVHKMQRDDATAAEAVIRTFLEQYTPKTKH